MSNITIIPARPQRANSQQNETEKPKLRVAAYCRVSTDSDEQATSYEAQVSHYTEQITRNPEWAFAGAVRTCSPQACKGQSEWEKTRFQQ